MMGNSVGIRPGLDIRGEGGLVVVPPSSTAVGSYRWRVAPWEQPIADAPDWLIDLASGSTAVAPEPINRLPALPPEPQALVRTVTAEVARQFERVERAEPGERNITLFKAAAVLGEFVGAGLILPGLVEAGLEIAAELCGLVHDDGMDAVRATIASGLKRGISQPRAIGE